MSTVDVRCLSVYTRERGYRALRYPVVSRLRCLGVTKQLTWSAQTLSNAYERQVRAWLFRVRDVY